jgi:WhiB family redox-sensing transcriptional regulator
MNQANAESAPTSSPGEEPSASSSPYKVGLCRHDDPEAWFPLHPVHTARATRICFNCPAQTQCARNALDCRATDGVWAGVRLPGKQEWDHEIGLEMRQRLEIIANWKLSTDEHQRRLEFAESLDLAAATRAPHNSLIADPRLSSFRQVKYSA